MTLTNTTVQITVTIPKVELQEEEKELPIARHVLHEAATDAIANMRFTDTPISTKILDCPSYPALNE